MTEIKIPVGVSSCVLGNPVRYDGGNKHDKFVSQILSDYFTYQPICPEMAIGMGTPRPTIRLQQQNGRIRLRQSTQEAEALDVTEKMQAFAEQTMATLDSLCGYIVCAKSTSCGMERVPIYAENGQHVESKGSGLFTYHLMKTLPWLPVEESGRLHDTRLRENFINRVFALNDFNRSVLQSPSKQKLVQFHSRYKYLLMASSPRGLKDLGKLVANLNQSPIERFVLTYRQHFMSLLKQIATPRKHANVLMHLQGYFKRYLSREQKKRLAEIIHDYRQGLIPLPAVLTLLEHYQASYEDPYLAIQTYFSPAPKALALRHSL